MSERFVLHASESDIEHYFDIETDKNFNITPNYNVSAGALHPLVFAKNNTPGVIVAKWGIIPPEANDERAGKENINIRLEEIQNDEWLSSNIEKQRALVPASGFYKWKSTENKTTPFYVRMLSANIMGLAGIYSCWKSPTGRELFSFGILTTSANTLIEPIDGRMPVVVPPAHFEEWLAEDVASSEILKKITDNPPTLTEMIVNRVSEQVNDISKNEPGLIQPIPK